MSQMNAEFFGGPLDGLIKHVSDERAYLFGHRLDEDGRPVSHLYKKTDKGFVHIPDDGSLRVSYYSE